MNCKYCRDGRHIFADAGYRPDATAQGEPFISISENSITLTRCGHTTQFPARFCPVCGSPLCEPIPDDPADQGLKVKYRVYKADNGEPVEDCFVLRPGKDPAARAALWVYADTTDNEILARDLRAWLYLLQKRQQDNEAGK